jgi:hypothetical protein
MKHALHSTLFALFLGSTAALADDMPTYKVLMKDGYIQPEVVEVAAQTRFRLEIRNEGPGAAEFESIELKKELVLAPGVTRNMIFFPLKPGVYKFFDDFHPATGQARIVAK